MYLNPQNEWNLPIWSEIAVKDGELSKLNSNQWVAGIRVDDPGMGGINVSVIHTIESGAKGQFSDLAKRSAGTYGEVMLLKPNRTYEIWVIPE